MTQVFLGLGSNLGKRSAQMDQAIALLQEHGCKLVAQSSDYENAAMLPDDAPDDWNIAFKNRVVEMECDHKPELLLRTVKQIEKTLGREDRGHWAPREIDIDILAYSDKVVVFDHLTIPHPHLAERSFVLSPWNEIAPQWMHPVSGLTVAQMCEALDD